MEAAGPVKPNKILLRDRVTERPQPSGGCAAGDLHAGTNPTLPPQFGVPEAGRTRPKL